MSCVEVSTIKHSYSIIVFDGQRLEESDKASFIINLWRVRVASVKVEDGFTFNSGRDDIVRVY